MCFSRTKTGGPNGSSNFVSPLSRLPRQVIGGGFPRPMLSLEAEEGRSKWTSENGTTVTGSDRWRGGLFDARKLAGGVQAKKNGHKTLVQRVQESPLKYSEMNTTVGRTIGSPAFLTQDGVRTGSNISIQDATAKVGPGTYAANNGGFPSSKPSQAAGAASAFRDSVPRFVEEVNRQPDSKYTNEWDTKHWNRSSATGKISHVTPKNCRDLANGRVDAPGPGAYHNPNPGWEANPGLVENVHVNSPVSPKSPGWNS